jgi:hypothetical protein
MQQAASEEKCRITVQMLLLSARALPHLAGTNKWPAL